jgi:hypothetical protein
MTLKKVMTILSVMVNKIVICLKYRNVIELEREWNYADYTPMYYYQYSPRLRAYKYKRMYKSKKFIMYERIV